MKNTMKIIGIIALIAVVMFAVACNRGGGSSAASGAAANSAEKFLVDLEKLVDEISDTMLKAFTGDAAAAEQIESLGYRLGVLIEQNAVLFESFTDEQMDKYDEILDKLGY